MGRPASNPHAGERREVLSRVENLGRDNVLANGIEDDQVGVAANRDRALARIETESPGGGWR